MRPVGDRVLNWAQSLGLNEYREVRFGWNPVLSGMKTLLETGAALEIPASA